MKISRKMVTIVVVLDPDNCGNINCTKQTYGAFKVKLSDFQKNFGKMAKLYGALGISSVMTKHLESQGLEYVSQVEAPKK